MSKVVLITGTSTGLGEALALQLSKQGYTTYATMRDTTKASVALVAQSKLGGLFIETLDVQSAESINRCVARVIEQEGAIDVLINNAGAGFVRTTEQASEAEVDWVMDVNFHGVVRTTKALLPYMRSAKQGHIINITSVGGLVGQPFNEFYCAAKFAVEGYTESLASYVQPSFGIAFTLVEPGGIQSAFATSALAQFQQSGGMPEDDYKPILERYIGGSQARSASGESAAVYQTSDEVAEVVIKCMAMAEPPLRIRTSEWAEELTAYKTKADPDGTLSRDKVIKLFL